MALRHGSRAIGAGQAAGRSCARRIDCSRLCRRSPCRPLLRSGLSPLSAEPVGEASARDVSRTSPVMHPPKTPARFAGDPLAGRGAPTAERGLVSYSRLPKLRRGPDPSPTPTATSPNQAAYSSRRLSAGDRHANNSTHQARASYHQLAPRSRRGTNSGVAPLQAGLLMKEVSSC